MLYEYNAHRQTSSLNLKILRKQITARKTKCPADNKLNWRIPIKYAENVKAAI